MQLKKIKLKKILIVFTLSLTLIPTAIHARTSAEIEEEIRKQQEVLNSTQKNLEQAQKNLEYYNSTLSSSQGGLPQIEKDIKKLEAEIDTNKYELELTKESKKLKELEKEQKEVKQTSTLKSIYMNWRIENTMSAKEMLHAFDYKKYETYSSVLTNSQQNNIYSIASDLSSLNEDINNYENRLAELNTKNKELQQKKEELENQIRYLNSLIAYSNNQIGSLGGQLIGLQGTISSLTNEHRAALQREAELQNQNPTNPGSGSSGNLSFTMRGRDAVQGHGVGLSQWGAHGMATNNPSATPEQIIKFYYTGVSVTGGFENRTINVQGYGAMNIEDYAAGIAEIPDKACGTAEQVAQRPDKYAIYNGNIWSCWPEATIKVKVILARTYGMFHGSVCTSAACQVYVGGNGKRWAVEETRGMAVLYNGNFIDAVYSSDNNQGFGTADNDTIWQNFEGYGTPYPYLRSVNDNSFSTPTYYTNKECRTNNYSYADIYDVIAFNKDTFYQAGYRPAINNLYNKLGGSITSMTFVRDASQRVKRIIFNGNNDASIGGSWFKALWNEWVYYKNKVNTSNCQDLGSPRFDYIYSQTLFLNTN